MGDDARCERRDALNLEGGVVTITASNDSGDERVFTVDENLIRSSSAFFDTALKKEWNEGQTRHVKLHGHELDIVEAYIQWLSNGNIALKHTEEHKTEQEASAEFNMLGDLYVLGESIIAPRLQDTVLDAFAAATALHHEGNGEKIQWIPTREVVNSIYNGTPEGSPARQLMVALHMHVMHERADWIKKWSTLWHPEFLEDLTLALLEGGSLPEDQTGDWSTHGLPCKYHRHAKDEPCSTSEKRKLRTAVMQAELETIIQNAIREPEADAPDAVNSQSEMDQLVVVDQAQERTARSWRFTIAHCAAISFLFSPLIVPLVLVILRPAGPLEEHHD